MGPSALSKWPYKWRTFLHWLLRRIFKIPTWHGYCTRTIVDKYWRFKSNVAGTYIFILQVFDGYVGRPFGVPPHTSYTNTAQSTPAKCAFLYCVRILPLSLVASKTYIQVPYTFERNDVLRDRQQSEKRNEYKSSRRDARWYLHDNIIIIGRSRFY